MNVAARMQAAAEPGAVLITASTHRLVADAFETVDIGEIALKGKTQAVHAYRVLAPKAVPSRRRGLERAGLESPMVGRDSQLETLRSLYDVVRAGRSRVAFVVGEPGIGKSRLLAEFHRWVSHESPADAARGASAIWLEGWEPLGHKRFRQTHSKRGTNERTPRRLFCGTYSGHGRIVTVR